MNAAVAGVAALAMAACGGGNPARTQVRIVIQSDLGAPAPLRELRSTPLSNPLARELIAVDPPMPFRLAVAPDDQLRPFSVGVLLGSGRPPDDLLLVRNVRDVPFVRGEARMLVLPLHGKCACRGTSCPPAGDPDCADLVAPEVTPLDDVTAAALPDGHLVLDARLAD